MELVTKSAEQLAAEAAAKSIRFKINGIEYPMPDFDKLTLGEARGFKRICGMAPIDAFRTLGKSDPDLMAAIIWLVMHRVDATVTPDDVDAIQFENLDVLGEAVEAGPPGVTVAEEPGISATTQEKPGLPASDASTA